LTKSKLLLQERLLNVESKTDQDNEVRKQAYQVDTKYKAEYFALLTLVLELCFLLCCCYLEHYDFRSYTELNIGVAKPERPDNQMIKSTGSKMDLLKQIGERKDVPTSIDQRKTSLVEKVAESKFASGLRTKEEPLINSKADKIVLAKKKRNKEEEERVCQFCSKDISNKRKGAKFCNAKCRKKNWVGIF